MIIKNKQYFFDHNEVHFEKRCQKIPNLTSLELITIHHSHQEYHHCHHQHPSCSEHHLHHHLHLHPEYHHHHHQDHLWLSYV